MRLSLRRLGLILLVVALHGCGSSVNDQLHENADLFLSAIGKNDYEHAHRYLSESLARRTSAEELKTFVAHTGLQQPGDRNWGSSESDGEQASLRGTVKFTDGREDVPVRVNFIKEGVQWKIAGLERGIEVATPKGETAMFAPSEKSGAELARRTTTAFAAAVNAGNLQQFWSNMADTFKKTHSAEQFTASFAPFVQDEVNLMPASRRNPKFDGPPTIRDDGELVLQGVFPTEPSRVTFEYRYVLDGEVWRESGLTITLVPKS